jgi:hypothetical protein
LIRSRFESLIKLKIAKHLLKHIWNKFEKEIPTRDQNSEKKLKTIFKHFIEKPQGKEKHLQERKKRK